MIEVMALAAPSAVVADRPASTPLPRRQARSGAFGPLPKGNPWVAGALSLAVTGLGQAYNDEGGKGLAMASPLLLVPAAWGLDLALQRGVLRTFAFTLNAGIKVWSVSDAAANAWTDLPATSSLERPR